MISEPEQVQPERRPARLTTGALGKVARWEATANRSLAERPITARFATVTVFLTSTVFGIAILVATNGGFPLERDGVTVATTRLPATWDTLLAPFHQHWNLIPIAIWDRIAAVFGTASPTPFLVVLLATHVVLATGMTALLARRIGAAYALAIGVPLGMLGSASYNYLAPWQVLFTISLLAGLVAVWASIDRHRAWPRRAAVVGALLIGVMSSNVVLFVILAMWIWFAYEGRPAQILETVPAVVLYGVWFLTYGISGLGSDGHPLALRTFVLVVPYILTGLASGTGGALGLPALAGAFVLGILAVRYRPPGQLVAFLVAIVAMFAVASFFRSLSGAGQAGGSRYITLTVYLAAFGVAAAGVRPSISEVRALAIGAVAAVFNLTMFGLALRRFP